MISHGTRHARGRDGLGARSAQCRSLQVSLSEWAVGLVLSGFHLLSSLQF